MKRTFNYQEKFAFSHFYPVVAFVILAVLCGVFQYGIALKSLQLLAYPNSMYIMIGCGVIFLVSALFKMIKACASKKNPYPIELDENGFSFPKGKEEKIAIAYTEITGLKGKHDDDEGHSVTVYTNGKSYAFREECFDNSSQFQAFSEALNQEKGKK